MPRSSPSTICATRTPKVSQMRSSVLSVIGLPASICCQWRAEKPNPIMSSCVYPLALRNFLTRWPKMRKNCRSFTTSEVVGDGWHQHHEQISWGACVFRGYSSMFIGRGSPRTSRAKGISNARVIRSSVFMVMGLPFSICCQWRAENPKEIMSSCV